MEKYEWKVPKSGPKYGAIIIYKEFKDMFPTPKGDGITKRSEDFILKYNDQEITVYVERVHESNYRIWGKKGELKDWYKQIGLITEDYLKKGGTITIEKIDGTYNLHYDPKGEETELFNPEYKAIPLDITETEENSKDIDNFYHYYRSRGQIEFITFHPSYSYEDFVESIRPKIDANEIQYEYHCGIFKKICIHAINKIVEHLKEQEPTIDLERISAFSDWNLEDIQLFHKETKKIMPLPCKLNHVLIIDEINRGDVAKIFGELITLIEDDKRIGSDDWLSIKLPYTNESFFIPPNLFILGTMNTADRSLALIDIALRRRFTFDEMAPKLNLLEDPAILKNDSVGDSDLYRKSIIALRKLNDILGNNEDIGKDKKIGHAYFSKLKTDLDILNVWQNKVLPLLEEYYYFDKEVLKRISNSIYSTNNGWDTDRVEEFINHIANDTTTT